MEVFIGREREREGERVSDTYFTYFAVYSGGDVCACVILKYMFVDGMSDTSGSESTRASYTKGLVDLSRCSGKMCSRDII